MMVHLSKANVTIANAVNLYIQVERLIVLPEINGEQLEWQSLAEQTIIHLEKKYKITTGTVYPLNSCIYHVIRFVAFLGSANTKHFEDNEKEYASDARAKILTQIDLVCIAMHEYAHVRLRQALDDFNLSSPFVLKKCDDVNEMEFGRMVEKTFFNGQIAWWHSLEVLNLEKIKSFITAIQTGTKLPTFDGKPKPVYRQPPVVSGVDITCVFSFR
ncbi:hypothetical protein HA402_009862 [Bradysia odoriphaga]|nr:hypothetical protein HA402_009862 [Bradysia odoriphaga]